MNEFWNDKKLGKHKQVAKQAELLYEHYALCDADKLLARLKESEFKFGNYGPCDWHSLLDKANLDDCLKPEYVTEALKVTTARPAIGKGEFLFVSIFNNVGFAKSSGDLVDLHDDSLVEVKGVNSTIGNGHSKKFRSLSKGMIYSVYNALGHTPSSHDLNASSCEKLKQIIGADESSMFKVFQILQNTAKDNREVVEEAVELYKNTKHLLRTIASMHLYVYLKITNAKYLLALNDARFRCFNAPNNLFEAYKILSKFSVDGWSIGKSGVSVTLD